MRLLKDQTSVPKPTNKRSTEPDHYRTRFHSGRPGEDPRYFDSPTFDDSVQGALALIDTAVREFPAAAGVSIKIYHVGGPYQQHHLVTEIQLQNVQKWHPKGNGPKVEELLPEDYILTKGDKQ